MADGQYTSKEADKYMTDKKLFTTIDEYISTFPADTQAILEKVRQAIHKAAADAIIVGGETFVTGEVMDRIGPRLRIIARTGIGVDRIDLDAATQRGIMVVNTPDGPTESTAEHAVALMLNLLKQVMIGDRLLRSGRG